MTALLSVLPLPYRLLGLALLVAAVWGHGWIKGANHGESKLAAFVAETRLAGVKAQAAADARASADRDRKAAADASYRKALARAGADLERLRNADSRTIYLPAAPASAGSADRITFDRRQLESAIRALDQGVQGLVDEGSDAQLKLDTAIRWAAQSPQ
jgi:hypothetical protein